MERNKYKTLVAMAVAFVMGCCATTLVYAWGGHGGWGWGGGWGYAPYGYGYGPYGYGYGPGVAGAAVIGASNIIGGAVAGHRVRHAQEDEAYEEGVEQGRKEAERNRNQN